MRIIVLPNSRGDWNGEEIICMDTLTRRCCCIWIMLFMFSNKTNISMHCYWRAVLYKVVCLFLSSKQLKFVVHLQW